MHAQQQPPSLPEGGIKRQVLTKTGPGEEDTDWLAPEVTTEKLTQTLDQGIASMRYDYVSLVDATLSV